MALLGRSDVVSDLLQVQRELEPSAHAHRTVGGTDAILENRSELSTITVTLKRRRPCVPTRPFQPGEAIKDALQSVVVAFQFLVTALYLGGHPGRG